MITFRFEETIRRPADEIWSFAADVARHPQWMGVSDAELLSGQGTSVGARGRETVRFGPFRWPMDFEVTAADPGRRLTWQTQSGGPFRGDITLELEADGPATTKATYRGELALLGPWRLLSPIVGMEVREGQARELRRLKALLEAPAA